MTKEILYTTAIDDRGDLVHIDNAEKDCNYYCPSCQGEFTLKKSGNTGKGSKRPHFAHKVLISNCTAESALHYSFKKELSELLDSYISQENELKINWKCQSCSELNEGNLLAKITSTREEYNLKVCQPDIALLDSKENVIAAIEIVVSHEPEQQALQYYEDNEIILIQINLSSDEDLNIVKCKISNPEIVDYCLNPDCSISERYSIEREILPYENKCNRCMSPLEKYAVIINSAFGVLGSLNFTDDELNIVKSQGSNIKIVTDTLTNKKYPISVCDNCKRRKSKYNRRTF